MAGEPPTSLIPVHPWPRAYARLAAALVLVGVAARLVRYLLRFPLWEDEAYVSLNIRDRSCEALLGQLDHLQVAPLLFLWGERWVAESFGYSEYALRLLPLLAGVGSVFLLWHLARRTLPPLAGVVAVGLLAVSRWPVSLSSQVKPYSFDLFFALVLLVPAVHWLQRPTQVRWLVLLAVLVPFALCGSFPAVFVAGGVSLALLPEVWRRASRPVWAAFVAYNAAMVASFVAFDVVIARQQLGPPGTRLHDFMAGYWGHGFPPLDGVAAFGKWLAVVHTGLLLAYPLGNANGAGALAFPFVVTGAVAAWRRGWWPLAVLCLAPFALNFVAAALHRYPYGGCCRLSQHLAPGAVLLFGLGVGAALGRASRTEADRVRDARVLAGVFCILAAAGAISYIGKPYREQEDIWSRDLAKLVVREAGAGEPIYLLNPAEKIPPAARWYLREAGVVAWPGDAESAPTGTGGRVWFMAIRYAIPPSQPTFSRPLTTTHQSGLSEDGKPTWQAVVWRADAHDPRQSP